MVQGTERNTCAKHLVIACVVRLVDIALDVHANSGSERGSSSICSSHQRGWERHEEFYA